MSVTTLLGLIGPLSIAVLLVVTGLLSRRLGEQTHAKPYYLGFFAAALLIVIGAAARVFEIAVHAPRDDLLLIVIEDGLPAIALSIGVWLAWRYWSWLLAERD